MSQNREIIGIVGGVGPYAGLDLMQKVFDQTVAGTDQDYPSVIHMSFSADIAPRPEFLLGASEVNPGPALGRIMARLARAGATLLAMQHGARGAHSGRRAAGTGRLFAKCASFHCARPLSVPSGRRDGRPAGPAAVHRRRPSRGAVVHPGNL